MLWQKIAAIAGGIFALWMVVGIVAVVFLLNSGLAGTSITEKNADARTANKNA